MRPVPLLAALVACAPTIDATPGDADTTTTTATTGSLTATAPDEPTTGEPATTSTSTADATASTSTTDPTADATTGAPAWCQGWQTAEGPPFVDLRARNGDLLADGSTLSLECGPQGLFMFGLYPTFGGFTPPGDILDVDLVVDVEGFNDNPEGHFYSAHPVGYYVACDDMIGGVFGVLPIFPFDNLEDLTALDGKPAQIHVVFPTDDEPIAVDLDVVLAVDPEDGWSFCGF